jgi:hypothetical protein
MLFMGGSLGAKVANREIKRPLREDMTLPEAVDSKIRPLESGDKSAIRKAVKEYTGFRK